MMRFLKILWGTPGRVRVVISIGAGCALGIMVPGSSVWWLLLLALLLLRSHILCVAAGWLAGFAVSLVAAPLCECTGRWILMRHMAFWQNLLSLPGIACFDINKARVTGSAVIAILTGAIVIIIAIVMLPVIHRLFLKSRGTVS